MNQAPTRHRSRQRSLCCLLLGFAASSACSSERVAQGSPDAGVLLDTVAPRVVAVFPEKDAQGVAPDTLLEVRFSEPVRADSVHERTWTLADEAGRAIALSIQLADAGARAIAVPTAPLVEGGTYRAALSERVTDLANNALQPTSWRFTVARLPLRVSSFEPVEGAVGQRGDVAVRVRFERAVEPSSVSAESVSVRAVGASEEHPGRLEVDGPTRSLTFTPTRSFAANATIEVTLGTALRTREGGALEAPVRWRFGILDGPRVLSTFPADGAREVPVDAVARVAFDVDVDPRSLTPDTVRLAVADGAVVPTRLEVAARAVTLYPEAPLYEGALLELRIGPGVRSLSATTQAAATRARFEIVASVPTLRATDPADGASDVPLNAPVTLFFSEALDPASVTPANVALFDAQNERVPATLAVLDRATYRLIPAALLAEASTFTLRIEDGPRDPYTYRVAAPLVRRFTTRSAPRGPAVWPAFGAIDVPTSATVALTFPQPMVLAQDAVSLRDEDDAPVPLTVNASDDDRTFVGQAPLVAGRRYALFGDGARMRDRSGVALSGTISTRFAVGPAADTTSPRVVATEPASAATAVSPGVPLRVLFDEALSPQELGAGATLLAFTDVGGEGETVPCANTLSEDGRTLTLTPSATLALSTRHVLRITAALRDPSGNPAVPRDTPFITRSPAPAALLSTVPAAGATAVPTSTLVRLVFDRPIALETLAVEGEADGERLLVAANYEPHVRTRATLEPLLGFPPDGNIVLRLLPGLRSMEGAATTTALVLTFKAGSGPDLSAPTAAQPSDAHRWPRGPLAFEWSEAIDLTSFEPSQVRLRDEDEARNLPAVITATPAGFEIAPRAPLRTLGRYTVRLPEGIEDLSGNFIEGAGRVLTATLDASPPALVARFPVEGARVSPDVPIELVFAQPMAANAWHAATLTWRSPAGVVLPLAWRRSEDARTLRVLPIPALSPGAHTLTLEAPALFEEGGRSLGEAPVTLTFLVSLMLGPDPLP